ncbi:MAG TPA: imidazole glycerol phosphate synthase subunit HisH [Acidobacteriaceae bacterium]|nr:imidazole glycerol phosphate synthase subunit HisH [Acidobacteriaceae bacterium]
MSTGKTVVIDYQTGNLNSACKSLRVVGADLLVTQRPEDLKTAARIVLPGVGHFASTERLMTSGIGDAVLERVAEGVPFLGICVGLQWLFAGSTEAPEAPGMGVFSEVCERFPTGIKSPHVGWNSLELVQESRLLRDLPKSPYVYFTHSYRAPVINTTAATTNYGGAFSSVIEKDNWMAVQFHPEKSGSVGLKILKNFMQVSGC